MTIGANWEVDFRRRDALARVQMIPSMASDETRITFRPASYDGETQLSLAATRGRLRDGSLMSTGSWRERIASDLR